MIPPPKLSAATLAEGIAAAHSRTIFVADRSREVATVDGLTIHCSEMCAHAAIIGIRHEIQVTSGLESHPSLASVLPPGHSSNHPAKNPRA
jgi:uncharacterized metal-binding protein